MTNVTNREIDGVSVVTLYGRIVFGEGSSIVRETVKSLIGEGKKKIVLDMKNIDYVDSSGLGALVSAHLSANTHGATMRLCNLGRKVSKALQLTRLTTVLQVYSTEAAAVASFSENGDEVRLKKGGHVEVTVTARAEQ